MFKMKKEKKAIFSRKYWKIWIVVLFFLIVCGSFIIYKVSKKVSNDDTRYYTGNIYSANYAANLIDSLDCTDYAVISPLNINVFYATMYNGADNKTSKELKSYFQSNLDNTNEILKEKLDSLEEEEEEKNSYNDLYLDYIDDYKDKEYDTLSIDKIKKLSTKEKQKLILLLRKIELSYEGIYETSNYEVKEIKNYSLTTEESNYNEYKIKEMIDKINDVYETYSSEDKVVNFNNFYYNDSFKIDSDFKDSVKDNLGVNFKNIEKIEEEINSDLKEVTNDNLKRLKSGVNKDSLLTSVNTLYMNYKWDDFFTSSSMVEFTDFKGNISIVEMMTMNVTEYYENDYAWAFSKDFSDGKYSFYGILPKSKDELNLSSLDLNNLLYSKKEGLTKIGLPKYSYTYEFDISKLNTKISSIYDDTANLANITDSKIYVGQAMQKVYLNIDFKGTIVSNYVTKEDSLVEDDVKKEIILNRPFGFMIVNNETNDILIMGKVYEMEVTN